MFGGTTLRFILSLAIAHFGLGQYGLAQSDRNAAALIATIPFAEDGGTSIFMAVRLNGGKPGWWVLDSGASECVVDRSSALGARLRTRGSRQLRGAGKGSVRLDSIRSAVRLEIAGRAIPTCEHFGAVSLNAATSGVGREIAGILGYEFFSRYIVRIDFQAHRIDLYDPARYTYAEGGDTLALQFVRKLPHVNVRIRTAHRPEIMRSLIVDTGSEDFVDDESVRRTPGGPGVTVSTTGLGKSYEAVIGTLDTVWIGKSMFTKMPGVAADVALVGNGVWSKFLCVFDYRNQRLFVARRVR
ncbi:MAG TPA: aspartyl protease family protein [Gemmatimonadaceae bacterium]|nr:aspartyl protease family protein [Gemmatimonadaceae bacterium]